jgi:hypothetical protein
MDGPTSRGPDAEPREKEPGTKATTAAARKKATTAAARKKATTAAARKKAGGGWVWTVLLLAVVVVPIGFGVISGLGNDSSTDVPAPEVAERADTVPILARAADSQGICYGWRLADGSTTVNVGSNLGDGIAVGDGDPRCPRWAEVAVSVTYTPESSEASDSWSLSVRTSDNLDFLGSSDDFARFGLDGDAFLDEPGSATCQAATMLPLLLAEDGVASPVPPPTAGDPAATPSPLPDAGSDFWRDRWGYLLAATGLLLVAGALIAVGWVARRRQLERT